MQRRLFVATVVVAGAAGCASLIGLETTTTVAPEAGALADARADADAAGGGDAGEDPVDGEVTDASTEACAPASRVSPSKTEAVVTTSGKTCGVPDAVLGIDGPTFRLDYNSLSTENETWDGRYVTGCLGVGFVGGPFRALTVRARAMGSACGNDCTPMPDSGTGCGTGHWFGLFFRNASGAEKWLATTAITSSLAEYTIALPPSIGANPYLYICRSSANRLRDDVEVDYVAACP